MPTNKDYVIEWQPSNYPVGDTQFQTGYVLGVQTFFADLAHDSPGSSTNDDSVSTQYNDASGNTAAYKVSVPSPLPPDLSN